MYILYPVSLPPPFFFTFSIFPFFRAKEAVYLNFSEFAGWTRWLNEFADTSSLLFDVESNPKKKKEKRFLIPKHPSLSIIPFDQFMLQNVFFTFKN